MINYGYHPKWVFWSTFLFRKSMKNPVPICKWHMITDPGLDMDIVTGCQDTGPRCQTPAPLMPAHLTRPNTASRSEILGSGQ